MSFCAIALLQVKATGHRFITVVGGVHCILVKPWRLVVIVVFSNQNYHESPGMTCYQHQFE
jgi:hypothetical protein